VSAVTFITGIQPEKPVCHSQKTMYHLCTSGAFQKEDMPCNTAAEVIAPGNESENEGILIILSRYYEQTVEVSLNYQ
jgi:hypothetical protein